MFMKIKVYYRLAVISFQSFISFKFNIFLNIFVSMAMVFIQILIWKALYSQENATNATEAITLETMLQYVVISSLLNIIITSQPLQYIANQIRTGNIALDLMRPFNFNLYIFSMEIGKKIGRVFIQIPILLIFYFSILSNLPGNEINILFTLIVIMNAIIIQYLINYIIGLLAFWWIEVWPMDMLMNSLIKLLSGSWIPLWFFPEQLSKVAEILPFKLIYFDPIRVILGQIHPSELQVIVLQQIIWVMIFISLAIFLWKYGTKKIVVQGG